MGGEYTKHNVRAIQDYGSHKWATKSPRNEFLAHAYPIIRCSLGFRV